MVSRGLSPKRRGSFTGASIFGLLIFSSRCRRSRSADVVVIHGVLLTGDKPRYISAKITGGQGFTSHFSDKPSEDAAQAKITAKYLTPFLQKLDQQHRQVAA